MPREGHKFSSWSIRSLSTHFNPHAPRGARRRLVVADGRVIKFQSTCPARGTTGGAMVEYTAALPISIHVPREGHDALPAIVDREIWEFQSTCPARGTTSEPSPKNGGAWISIHVPREGHDSTTSFAPIGNRDFNPRAPRGARRLFVQF